MSEYPKRYMSITELVEMGFSRAQLNQAAHAVNSPCIRTSNKKRSKIKFDTTKIDTFMGELFPIM